MDNKALYRELCQKETSIPIFSRDWWLDAVCGENDWDVAIEVEDGEILGSMPYMKSKKLIFTFIGQPLLTQFLGPWFSVGSSNDEKSISQQNKIMASLIEQLPKCHYFSQNWNYSVSNWLPFYWAGFNQTTRYTYVLNKLDDIDSLWRGLRGNIQREIRKAENRFDLKISESEPLDVFIGLMEKTFARQGKHFPYSRELIQSIDAACKTRNAGKMWLAVDEHGRSHAGIYVIWDSNSAYYLMGGGDPELRTSGASSYLLWHAIKYTANFVNRFDFEGSMLKSVEKFFRAFGSTQVPYLKVYKSNSYLLNIYKALKK